MSEDGLFVKTEFGTRKSRIEAKNGSSDGWRFRIRFRIKSAKGELSNLLDLGKFESAIDYLIEKEIESILRKSHSEHFEWLESKLSTTLRKDLNAWPDFIELTERRNPLVHCDGVASHQYLANCKRLPRKICG